jgi:hypothetical protein
VREHDAGSGEQEALGRDVERASDGVDDALGRPALPAASVAQVFQVARGDVRAGGEVVPRQPEVAAQLV